MALVRAPFAHALSPHMPSLTPKIGFAPLGSQTIHLAPRTINPREAAAIRAKIGQTPGIPSMRDALVSKMGGMP